MLESRNKSAAKLHPRRFVIVGVVAFIIGLILA